MSAPTQRFTLPLSNQTERRGAPPGECLQHPGLLPSSCLGRWAGQGKAGQEEGLAALVEATVAAGGGGKREASEAES